MKKYSNCFKKEQFKKFLYKNKILTKNDKIINSIEEDEFGMKKEEYYLIKDKALFDYVKTFFLSCKEDF